MTHQTTGFHWFFKSQHDIRPLFPYLILQCIFSGALVFSAYTKLSRFGSIKAAASSVSCLRSADSLAINAFGWYLQTAAVLCFVNEPQSNSWEEGPQTRSQARLLYLFYNKEFLSFLTHLYGHLVKNSGRTLQDRPLDTL